MIATIAGDVAAGRAGGRSSHHHVGADGMVAVLEGLPARGLRPTRPCRPGATEVAVFMLAGVDLAGEEGDVRAALEARGWAAA